MLYSMEKAAWIYFNKFDCLADMKAVRRAFGLAELNELLLSINHYCGSEDEASADVANAIANY